MLPVVRCLHHPRLPPARSPPSASPATRPPMTLKRPTTSRHRGQLRGGIVPSVATRLTIRWAERNVSGAVAPSGLVLPSATVILEPPVDITTTTPHRAPPVSLRPRHRLRPASSRRPPRREADPPGASGRVAALDKLLSRPHRSSRHVATVISKRAFAGYWIFPRHPLTSPPRLDHSGAALITTDASGRQRLALREDAVTPGERLPGKCCRSPC